MSSSIDDLERRVSVLEALMRANDAEHADIHTTLRSLEGGQNAILDMLRDHGRLLGTHESRLDGIDGKLTRLEDIDGKLQIVLAWIGTQP